MKNDIVLRRPRRVSDLNRVLICEDTGRLFRSTGIASQHFGVSPAFIVLVAGGRARSNSFRIKWVELKFCQYNDPAAEG
jgi:hypothetical protein